MQLKNDVRRKQIMRLRTMVSDLNGALLPTQTEWTLAQPEDREEYVELLEELREEAMILMNNTSKQVTAVQEGKLVDVLPELVFYDGDSPR